MKNMEKEIKLEKLCQNSLSLKKDRISDLMETHYSSELSKQITKGWKDHFINSEPEKCKIKKCELRDAFCKYPLDSNNLRLK